jgi:mannosyltransferase
MIKILKNNNELLLLTIISLVIRLINLGKLNLWLDEGVTAQTIHSGLSYIIRDSFTAEPTPPLYNALMYFWVQLFGDSEFALRFPSACFGALSISLVYLIGKKYVSKEVGVLSAFLLIGNPFYLYYSQEARSYTLFSFFALLSVYYFPMGLEWKDKKNYLIATLLVPWVHAYGVFLILA